MSSLRPGDPCPCGSGKKYKKCCIGNAATTQTIPTQAAKSKSHEFNVTNAATPSELLLQAVALHQAGQLDEAKAAYQSLLINNPDDSDALHYLGLIAFQRGDYSDAAGLIEQAVKLNGKIPAFHFNLGNAYKQLKQLDSAADAYLEAIRLNPRFLKAHLNLGNTFKEQGKLEAAVESYHNVLALKPDYALAYGNLGNALQAQGKLEAAVKSYNRALSLNPDYAEAYNNLGTTLHKQGKLDTAVESYNRALSLKPDYAEAHYKLGLALREQDKLDAAVESYRKALLLRQDYAEAHNNLGAALQAQGKLEAAVESYQRALALKPDYADAHFMLAAAFQEQGKLDEAIASCQKSFALKANSSVRIACGLMLPPIIGSREEMLSSRTRLEKNLDSLIEDEVVLADPYMEGCTTNFYLAYHGLNDRDIQQKVARLYEKACPSLLYVAPHCAGPRPAGNKMRIGFLSRFIYDHSVSRCFNRIVKDLSRHEGFEVMLISSYGHQEESASKMYDGFKGTHVRLPYHLARAREKVAALELDILVYLDIGMDPFSYFLAFSRLARAQCVLGGHPVTTGIRNMDYFLSSVLAEPEDGDTHYSEKLVRLPIGPYYFERPSLPATFKTRKELGLPEDGHIYVCPMRLQKIHPDFDEAIARILQLDPGGYVVLFGDKTHTSWEGLLEKRFEQTIPGNVRNRVLFLPWVNDYSDFIGINKASDVVLDPFHFGIGSTAVATFSVSTPIVTKPGNFMRGRVGLQLCKLLNLPECVAVDTEDYAQKAVAIATEYDLRARIKSKIAANNHLLLDNPQTIEDMANFFLGLNPNTSLLA